MTGKFGLLAVAIAMAASAQVDLAIVSGGKRIIDRDPSNAATNCSGWVYDAAPLVDDNGNVVAMYSVSDAIANHCKAALDSPARFGDVIRRHELNSDGTWTGGSDVIGRANLTWMNDPSFLTAHPETFVGHLASPSVARVGGRYFMAFVGSVDDPNLCAGEHPASGDICGSCVMPWSYFVAMWAVSDDGSNWRVYQRSPGNPMLFGALPVSSSPFKGITHVTVVPFDDAGRKYFYVGAQLWGALATKMLMVRVPYDATADAGIGGDPEMWDGILHAWVSCPGGVVPGYIDRPDQFSLVAFDALSSIAPTTIRGIHEYISLNVSDGVRYTAGRGRANRITYAFSSNLVNWTFADPLRSTIPWLADGTSYDSSVIDPVVVDEHGALRLFLASADGDDAGGIARDGVQDCAASGFGATAPYVGTGIYEARIESVVPVPTRMTIATDGTTFNDGETVRCHVTVTDSSGHPVNGNIVAFAGNIVFSIVYARVIDGHADVDVPVRGVGTHTIRADFPDQGLSLGTFAVVNVQVVPNSAKRRSVRSR